MSEVRIRDAIASDDAQRESMRAYIRERTSEAALCEMVAEEAAELSHAASKMGRVLRGEVPTPKTEEKAREDLAEEYSDLLTVAHVMNLRMDPGLSDFKLRRWVERLHQKERRDAVGEIQIGKTRDDASGL